ncbi:hypothetical protein P1P68_22235 [Streptomyces scabiei]|uniref:hypothetical protein n=1 Tax=Streptomyces scabiei TaxID=1930 RepID=UPI00298FCE44|nr:hypothetical protein [Streptomyces scabiei]MDW8807429.1 hypothetical protein [Streptomyces scabiei]
MGQATAAEGRGDPETRMTIRVYSVAANGTITGDSGTVSVRGGDGPVPTSDAFPPCRCPRHRAARAR